MKKNHDCERVAREVEHKLSQVAPAAKPLADVPPPAILTQLATVSPQTIVAGVPHTLPAGAALAISASPSYPALRIEVNLLMADKLAVGKSMTLDVYLSLDGSTANGQMLFGMKWISYGPGGYTSSEGTVNPDPSRDVPLAQFAGHGLYLIYQTVGITNVGATVYGLAH